MTLTRRPYKPGAYSTIKPARGRQKRREDPVTADVYDTVMTRAGHRCELRVRHCRGRLHWHHRKPVEHGGPSTVPNGMALCESCHTWAHRLNPAAAKLLGVLVDRRDDPATTPVMLHDGRRVIFGTGGEYLEAAA